MRLPIPGSKPDPEATDEEAGADLALAVLALVVLTVSLPYLLLSL